MASVKISDRLYNDIVSKARRMVGKKIEVIEKTKPVIDMETIYNKLISLSEQSLLKGIPKKYLNSIESFTFTGFYNAPNDIGDDQQFDSNDHKKAWHLKDYDTADTELGEANGCQLNTRYDSVNIRCDWNDSKWDYLKPDYVDYSKKMAKQEEENKKFVKDVQTIADSFSTIRKMVEAYPFMWDLIPQEDKDRANAPTEKRDTAQQVAKTLDVDKDKLNAIVTLDKITRGGNDNG